MTTVSKAQRIWIMVGGGFVLALPVGLLMRLTSEGGFLEGLLSLAWLAGVVAWCVYVVRRWPLASRGGGVVPWVSAPAPAPAGTREAYLYQYGPMPPPGLYWVDVQATQFPDRMQGERSAFAFVDGVLVGGVVPYWLGEYEARLPERLVVDVREGEAFVLFPV